MSSKRRLKKEFRAGSGGSANDNKKKKRKEIEAKARLARIYKRLMAIPEGKAVVDFIKDNDIEVKIDDQHAGNAGSLFTIKSIKNATYEYGQNGIVLSAHSSDDVLLQALAHETQHMRHHAAGVGNPQVDPPLSDHCWLRRVQEADAQAACIDLCYRLKQAGDDGPWQATQDIGYKQSAAAFEKAVKDDPKSLDDGHARRAAFDAWFTEPGMKDYYDADTIRTQIPFFNLLKKNNPGHGLKNLPLGAGWLQKIGDVSPVNHLKLKDAKSLRDPIYTKGFSQKNRKMLAALSQQRQIAGRMRGRVQRTPPPGRRKKRGPGG